MRLLSIDYGDKRIGLAISDENEKLASRFLTFENKSPESTIKKISKVIADEKAGKVIVGLPVGFREESDQTRRTREFTQKLRKSIKIPVIEINEIFTSKMAEKNLKNAGIKNKKEIIDQEAARIILQEYLDRKNSF